MNTKEAYKQAVKELCTAARCKHFDTVSWIAVAVEIMWERLCQEAIAESMGAFRARDTIKLANSYFHTRDTIQEMKDDETYSNIFKANIGKGLESN